MQQAAWNQKSIKMIPHGCDKITSGKVTLRKINDTWEISLNAFWTRPTKGQMFLVGTQARKVMDIDSVKGSFFASRKLSGINWSDFIYNAKMIVIISQDIPVLTANIPVISDTDIHSAMTIIRCGEDEEITPQDKKETVKKEVEQIARREQIQITKNKQDITSLLTINPAGRKRAPLHLKQPVAPYPSHVKHTPMDWNIPEMEKTLKRNTIPSPFIGNFKGAEFARIDIAEASGFDHMIICKVPVNNMHIFMMGVPGKAITPPYGLNDFNRWIPAIKGNGYWVKYLLNN